MKDLTKAFIRECIDIQEYKVRQKANYIEMHNYFKDSGEIEEEKELISKWIYNENSMCNQIHEYYEEKQTEGSETKGVRKYLGQERI